MPAIAAAAGAAALTSVGAAAAAGTLAQLSLGTVLFAAASGAASAALQMALAPSLPNATTRVSQRQGVAFGQVVYGRRRVSGTYAYLGNKDGDEGILEIVIVWADHEIEEIEAVYMGDALIWEPGATPAYRGAAGYDEDLVTHYRVEAYHKLGTSTQSAFSKLVAECADWTSAHRLRGRACTYLRMNNSLDVFPQGLTNLTAIVKGKKIYDPRDGSTAWSENPALCLRDYVVNHVGVAAAKVPDAYVNALANICEEQVDHDGGTDDRYRITAAFAEGVKHREIIETMLGAMNARAVFIGGEFRMMGGAYAAPDVTLTDDDVIGGVSVVTRQSVRDRWNQVRGVYTPEDSDGVPTYTPKEYPILQSAAYEAADGRELVLPWDLPFTPTHYMAQRLAKMRLLQSRQQIFVTVPCNLKALAAVAGGGVSLTLERFGWTAKEFEVTNFSLSIEDDGGAPRPVIALSLRETSSAIWDWSTSDEQPDVAGAPSSLGSGFTVSAPSIAASDELATARQEIVSILVATLTQTDAMAALYEVEAKKSSDSVWRPMSGAGGQTRFELSNVADGESYDIRARTINNLGLRSAWATASYTVVGKTDPPSDVTDLRLEVVGSQALLQWAAVSDLDLAHYEVRFQPVTSGGSYANAQVLVEKVARPATSVIVPAALGTYFVKAVDKFNKRSASAASVIPSVEEISGFETIDSVTDTAFSGTKTDMNTTTPGGGLALDQSGGVVVSEGYYTLGTKVDLGAKYAARLEAVVTYTRHEFGANMSGWTDPISTYLVNWSAIGVTSSDQDVSARVEVRSTDDDPSGSPTWGAWAPVVASDRAARGHEIRARATSESGVATPLITQIDLFVKMAAREEKGQGVSSGASAKSITYGAEFKNVPTVQITPADMATGDYYTVTSETVSGFTVTFYDSTDTAVSRTFNWRAFGEGKKIT